MTITINGLLLTKATKLTGSSPTTVFTAKSRATLISIICTEIAGATPSLTIEVFDGTSSFYLRKLAPMTARQTFVFNEPIALNAGQELRVTASAANQIDCFVAYMPNSPTGGTFMPTNQAMGAPR
jgi:hypothetical protein